MIRIFLRIVELIKLLNLTLIGPKIDIDDLWSSESTLSTSCSPFRLSRSALITVVDQILR